MPRQVTNRITAHEISWMDDEFGWLTLLNGTQFAGYIYFLQDSANLMVPHLDSDDSIVFSVHMSHLLTLLDILRNDKPLQLRFFDPQADGVKPSAFIESVSPVMESARAISLFKKLSEMRT